MIEIRLWLDSKSKWKFIHGLFYSNFVVFFRFNLLDSSVQIITHVADAKGYVADVKYKGEAQYSEHRPVYALPPALAYKPAY